MTHDPQDSIIVLRLPRSQKGRYVAASRASGLTLAAWILARLDTASAPIPPPDDSPGRAGDSHGRDPEPR